MDLVTTKSGLHVPRRAVVGAVSQMMQGGNYLSTKQTSLSTANWNVSNGSADQNTITDLRSLRNQSRELNRTNCIGRGAIGSAKTNVISTGLKPQSRVDYEYLGITQEQAKAWQKTAERLFWTWADSIYSDSEMQLTWWEQQMLAFGSMLESGDVIGLRRFKKRNWSKFGICYQWIEADRLATKPEDSSNKLVRMGIRFSKDGEPEFYNILNKHPGEYSFSNNDMGSVEVPAFDADGLKVILHLFNKERPGQSRGIPMLAAVIKPIKDLGVYQDAEITAAVVSGMFAMFIESPDADVAENGLIPGMIKNGTSPAVDGAVPSAMGVQKLSPGMILEGMPGEKASSINPGRPSSAFEPFVNACLAQIGMGLGIPKEVFLKLYQTSFTAARAAILDAKKIWDLYRAGFATRVCQPTWEAVLFESVARGYLSAPGFLEDVEIRTAYTNCYWTGTPPGSVDPYKEAKAEELWMKLGIKTQQRVTQEQTGEDWAEVTAQRKIERDLLAQSNLTGGSNQMEKEVPASNPQKNNPEENDFQESEDDKENLPEDLKKEDE